MLIRGTQLDVVVETANASTSANKAFFPLVMAGKCTPGADIAVAISAICPPLIAGKRRSVAGLDGRHSCGRVGTAEALEVHSARAKEVVNAALEVSRGDVGVQVSTRARGLGQVPMARQGVGRNVKVLSRPCERASCSLELGLRHGLLIEVSFAEDQEMARRVVVRGGIARDLGAPQFVDVAIAVDADVIGDVDPSVLVLVVSLILSEMAWGISVFAKDDGLMVQSHPGDGVALPSRAGRSRAPRVAA